MYTFDNNFYFYLPYLILKFYQSIKRQNEVSKWNIVSILVYSFERLGCSFVIIEMVTHQQLCLMILFSLSLSLFISLTIFPLQSLSRSITSVKNHQISLKYESRKPKLYIKVKLYCVFFLSVIRKFSPRIRKYTIKHYLHRSFPIKYPICNLFYVLFLNVQCSDCNVLCFV